MVQGSRVDGKQTPPIFTLETRDGEGILGPEMKQSLSVLS